MAHFEKLLTDSIRPPEPFSEVEEHQETVLESEKSRLQFEAYDLELIQNGEFLELFEESYNAEISELVSSPSASAALDQEWVSDIDITSDIAQFSPISSDEEINSVNLDFSECVQNGKPVIPFPIQNNDVFAIEKDDILLSDFESDSEDGNIFTNLYRFIKKENQDIILTLGYERSFLFKNKSNNILDFHSNSH